MDTIKTITPTGNFNPAVGHEYVITSVEGKTVTEPDDTLLGIYKSYRNPGSKVTDLIGEIWKF